MWGRARGPRRVGDPGENSLSGKTGIHFKISAQKGGRAVLKPGMTPRSPWNPHVHGGPWQGSRGKKHLF